MRMLLFHSIYGKCQCFSGHVIEVHRESNPRARPANAATPSVFACAVSGTLQNTHQDLHEPTPRPCRAPHPSEANAAAAQPLSRRRRRSAGVNLSTPPQSYTPRAFKHYRPDSTLPASTPENSSAYQPTTNGPVRDVSPTQRRIHERPLGNIASL